MGGAGLTQGKSLIGVPVDGSSSLPTSTCIHYWHIMDDGTGWCKRCGSTKQFEPAYPSPVTRYIIDTRWKVYKDLIEEEGYWDNTVRVYEDSRT